MPNSDKKSEWGPSLKNLTRWLGSAAGLLALALFLAQWGSTGSDHSSPANESGPASLQMAGVTSSIASKQLNNSVRSRLVENYGKLPLSFEPNIGQLEAPHQPSVKFLARGNGYTLAVDPDGAVMRLRRRFNYRRTGFDVKSPLEVDRASVVPAGEGSLLLDMKLVDAARTPTVVGMEELPGKVNYLRGNDPKQWKTNISTYAKVKLENVYPGIDLVYYGNQGQLEYDFVVAPGADPERIRISVQSDARSDSRLRVDAAGDLIVAGGNGEVKFHKPKLYQVAGAQGQTRIPVGGEFKLVAGNVAFQVDLYDHSKPLVIDPVLVYSTFLGGSNIDNEEVYGVIAVDSAGNAYVAGETDSTDFPVVNPFQASHGASYDSDATVTKINASGTALVYSTYLGGSREDYASGIAVDTTGAAYVAGNTCSPDFPVTTGAYQTSFVGGCISSNFGGDVFVTKFDPSGAALEYSTYFGGTDDEIAARIAIDLSGNAYVTGETLSTDLPVTPGVVQPALAGVGVLGVGDGFVAKFNATGSALSYSTYLGGTGDDYATAIAVDSSGNAYITGGTNSTDFPITSKAFQKTMAGSGAYNSGDAFATKLNPTATALVYSTYLGGSDDDGADAIAVDKHGNAFIAGWTDSSNFPVTPTAFQVVFGGFGALGYGDVFVTKLNSKGSAVSYSTYVGADQDEWANDIALDASGAWVVGATSSEDFPTTPKALQRHYGGIGATGYGDAFIFHLNPKGTALTYSSFIGGTDDDQAGGVAVGPGGVYVTGSTGSPNFPVTSGAYDTSCGTDGACNATWDAFILKLKP